MKSAKGKVKLKYSSVRFCVLQWLKKKEEDVVVSSSLVSVTAVRVFARKELVLQVLEHCR